MGREIGRICWQDPDGNYGHGEWLPYEQATAIGAAYATEVAGRKVEIETREVLSATETE